jgi:uncharacterized membrane protein YbhN (UPF0104 family)
VNFRIPKYLQTGIKLVLTAAALYYVLGNVDLQSIWLLVIKSNKVYLLFALVLFIFSKVVSSARLWFYLHKLDISITQRENLKLYWLGMYYNLFLPGGIGGDGYKTYWLRKRSGKTTAILISTLLLDRFSGLTMLVLLTVGLFYTLDILPELRFYPWIGVLLVLTTFFILLESFSSLSQHISVISCTLFAGTGASTWSSIHPLAFTGCGYLFRRLPLYFPFIFSCYDFSSDYWRYWSQGIHVYFGCKLDWARP